ncbi:MAG: hypothetical protein ABI863_17270 [Ginsengibacter sp.]
MNIKPGFGDREEGNVVSSEEWNLLPDIVTIKKINLNWLGRFILDEVISSFLLVTIIFEAFL